MPVAVVPTSVQLTPSDEMAPVTVVDDHQADFRERVRVRERGVVRRDLSVPERLVDEMEAVRRAPDVAPRAVDEQIPVGSLSRAPGEADVTDIRLLPRRRQRMSL